MPYGWLRAFWFGKRRRQERQRIARYFDCTWLSAWGEENAASAASAPRAVISKAVSRYRQKAQWSRISPSLCPLEGSFFREW